MGAAMSVTVGVAVGVVNAWPGAASHLGLRPLPRGRCQTSSVSNATPDRRHARTNFSHTPHDAATNRYHTSDRALAHRFYTAHHPLAHGDHTAHRALTYPFPTTHYPLAHGDHAADRACPDVHWWVRLGEREVG